MKNAWSSKSVANKPCKIVMVFVGDNPYCEEDVFASFRHQIPVVLLEGSRLANDLLALRAGQTDKIVKCPDLAQFVVKEKVYTCKDSAEDAASVVNLFLSIAI